ncbi:MAG: hypothetical protein LBP79_05495 [Clostridiales bacterium]|jgi:hypothetical protein|nr:hypothetical protein [Clostridiales bacterium]
MIKMNETRYKNFGKCIELTNGGIRALITVDVGPRIICYGTADGRNNIMFEDADRRVKKNCAYLDENFKKGETWFLYGGHRMWKAPEDEATYIPDNYPVEYTADYCADGAEVSFSQPFQKNTGLKFDMKVRMYGNGGLRVRHIMKNLGEKTVNAAVWGISVLKAGGVGIFPLNTGDAGYLPNNFLSLWSYDRVNDERLSFADGYMLLKQNPNAVNPFKIGFLCKRGAAAYAADDLVFVKKFAYEDGAVYPDNNCNFESYTSDLIFEAEGLSPLRAVEPRQSAEHIEEFFLFERALKTDKESLNGFFSELPK